MKIWMQFKPEMKPLPGDLTAICHGCGQHARITKAGYVCKWDQNGDERSIIVFTCSDECEKVITDNPEAVATMVLEILKEQGIQVKMPIENPKIRANG